jgi:hypothetical protein
MAGQHQFPSTSLPATLLSCVLAALYFAASTWYPLRLWRPLTCVPNSKGSCDFEPMIALIGVAIAAFVHSCCVALFAWTPLSAPLRSSSQVSQPNCLFNAFLHASMVFDAAAYGYALTFIDDLAGFLQVLNISFSVLFLVLVPYLVAAYRDPSTDLGSMLHVLKARMVAYRPNEQQVCSIHDCETDLQTNLERAFLISPASRQSPELRDIDVAREFQSRTKMRPFPRFQLLVTPASDSSPV